MQDFEFIEHVNFIFSVITKINLQTRIILNHKPYTTDQEHLIEEMIRKSDGIIVAKIERHPNPKINGKNLGEKLLEIMKNPDNSTNFYIIIGNTPKRNFYN